MDDLFGANLRPLPFKLPGSDRYEATWNKNWHGYDVRIPDGSFFYAEQFFSQKLSERVVDYLQKNDTVDWNEANWATMDLETMSRIKFANIQWRQDWINLYGKRLPLPRLTSWYGDSGKTYTYSGIRSEPNPWNEALLHIKRKIERCAGTEFNSVLLNWYRSGYDHLGWHSDDEKELGSKPIIASASFGDDRDFIIRRKDDHAVKIVLPLKHGSMLIMRGDMQEFWQHSVPKRPRSAISRFNMTFRKVCT